MRIRTLIAYTTTNQSLLEYTIVTIVTIVVTRVSSSCECTHCYNCTGVNIVI